VSGLLEKIQAFPLEKLSNLFQCLETLRPLERREKREREAKIKGGKLAEMLETG
jgi:hypothetical protein